ncbi:hypothetical protein [Actinocorallia libanotica]|uniref:Uncharacterized protein n=1 Tax=Actinocorallia libanotica TaxID=46162 RepID=A0ABN1RVC7_9ACTN
MFGEMLLAAPPADLEVTFGEVRCPTRIVAVTIANTGAADERYALRVAGEVQRTELVPAGTTVISRVRLAEDRPTVIAVHTTGESAASARRTADCSAAASAPAASAPAAPEPKGGTPAAGEPRPAPSAGESGTPAAEPSAAEPDAGTAPGTAPGTPPPPASRRQAHDAAPPAPKGAVSGTARKSAAEGRVREEVVKKAKKRRNVVAGDTRRQPRPQTLPMTGISPAFAYTGAGAAVTGGVLAWYALLWPGRRTESFPSRERTRT